MPKPEHYGHAALVGWRKAVANATAPRVANAGPLSEDQARAIIGGVLFAASFYYVVSTIVRLVKTARD
jgi:xanthine/uracil permease